MKRDAMRKKSDFFYDWGAVHKQADLSRGRGFGEEAPTAIWSGDLFVISDPNKTLHALYKKKQLIDFVGAHELFRQQCGDDYDIISFFVDPDYIPNIGSGSTVVFNDVRGIGLPERADRKTWNSTRLLHHTHHYKPFTARGLLHELGHMWCAYVNYRDAEGRHNLLHEDFPFETDEGQPQQEQASFHWGRWADHRNSCMSYDRHEWTPNQEGTYTSLSHWADDWLGSYFGYWELDQYLMGLIPKDEVPDWIILREPKPALPPGSDRRSSGPHACEAIKVSVSDVIAEEGERIPSHLESQRVFHQAFCAIVGAPDADGSFVRECQRTRAQHEANFRWATLGRAVVDTRLLKRNVADIYIRNKDTDEGEPGRSGAFWDSPDVWVRNIKDEGLCHQPPIPGQTNWIKVRVHNRGNEDYTNVTINAYAASAGLDFLYPADWRPDSLIGCDDISVPANSYTIATIEWRASLLSSDDVCIPVLLVELMPLDPDPNKLHRVWESRKLAMKNVTIIEPSLNASPLMWTHHFAIGNALRRCGPVQLAIDAERDIPGLSLFLDPGGLVQFPAEAAPRLSIPLSPASQSMLVRANCMFPVGGCSARSDKDVDMEGLEPVLLNDVPLLRLAKDSSKLTFSPYRERRSYLRMVGIGIGRRCDGHKEEGIYHLSESDEAGNRLGGSTLHVIIRGC